MTGSTDKIFRVRRSAQPPPIDADADHPLWSSADVADVCHFHPRGGDHRPVTHARLLYDASHLYLLFNVQDQYVRCVHTEFQSQVCLDSCVEFFVQPRRAGGYFNFEINCGGTMMLLYITDTKPADGLRVSRADAEQIRIYHSLPRIVEPEITDNVAWRIGLSIPFAILEKYAGPTDASPGKEWRANFYKCGDHTSHPHFGAWSPIGNDLNFHQPRFFGTLRFE